MPILRKSDVRYVVHVSTIGLFDDQNGREMSASCVRKRRTAAIDGPPFIRSGSVG
jgi:hypothetical protein